MPDPRPPADRRTDPDADRDSERTVPPDADEEGSGPLEGLMDPEEGVNSPASDADAPPP